jgi:hypothetical protein
MSLNGIMGIGLLSVGAEDERLHITRAEREVQQPVAAVMPDNLSAVQQDYVTLNSGVGEIVPVRTAGVQALTQSETVDRGSGFRAIA